MKYHRSGSGILFVFISILLISNFASALPPLDYGDITIPKFKSVDVVIETEWNTTEKTENVNVVEIKDKDKTFGLVLVKELRTLAEVTLVKGIAIKIYDHDSGKLLHTYILES
jgi:hypothetical protein